MRTPQIAHCGTPALSGAFFLLPQSGSDTDMESNLKAIVRPDLAEARVAGKNHLTQTEEVVRAVLQAFPDMTASDELAQVNTGRFDG